MVKTVFELLSEIYNGNFYKLPEKIKIDGKIWEKGKNTRDYKEAGEHWMWWLADYCANEYNDVEDWLKLPVEEVEEVIGEKWKPKIGEEYWYFYDWGDYIAKSIWTNRNRDNYRYYLNICFKTRKEAEQHLENIKTEAELRQLAEELNNGEKFDWEDTEQEKYYLYYDGEDEEVYGDFSYIAKFPKQIYCLRKNFKDKALEQIGKERIINYLKEE